MNNLVSIIIPTYNRAQFIGETLDSVITQTYTNWECIVVDDGSADYTQELMEFYCERDSRIQYYLRPKDRPKGANACRNYGLELSKGSFIQWFDSDDLMMKKKLELKINGFVDNIDFIISDSINFSENGVFSRHFQRNYDIPITAENFINQRIGWLTPDLMIRRAAIVLKFNERLLSGQEYNFFSRLLFFTNKGKYLKTDLVKRRLHSNSIQENLKTLKKDKIRHLFLNDKILLKDIHFFASRDIKTRSLSRLIRFSYQLSKPFSIHHQSKEVLCLLRKNKRYTPFILYGIWIVSNLICGKGYFLISLTMKRLQ